MMMMVVVVMMMMMMMILKKMMMIVIVTETSAIASPTTNAGRPRQRRSPRNAGSGHAWQEDRQGDAHK
jgi:hypothetical protein